MNAFLRPYFDRLDVILKSLEDMKLKSSAPLTELHRVQDALRDIEQEKVDGKFVPKDWDAGKDPNAIPEGIIY